MQLGKVRCSRPNCLFYFVSRWGQFSGRMLPVSHSSTSYQIFLLLNAGPVLAYATGIGNPEQGIVKISPKVGGRCLWSIGPHGTSFSYSLHCLRISSPYVAKAVGTFCPRSLAASYSSTFTRTLVLVAWYSTSVSWFVARSPTVMTLFFSLARVRRARSSLVLKLISCNHQNGHRNRGKKKQEHELLPPHKKRNDKKKRCAK